MRLDIKLQYSRLDFDQVYIVIHHTRALNISHFTSTIPDKFIVVCFPISLVDLPSHSPTQFAF
jgi:hypothetical protein